MGLSGQRRHWIILYHRLDCIVLSAGSYHIVGWIILYRLDQETLAFMRWLVTGWMGRMVWMGHWWDGGGTDKR